MTEAEMLEKVKRGLGIFTDFQDEVIMIYMTDVMEFMKSAGVKEETILSVASVGCILQGVNDLWNYTGGGTKFSEYFKMRVVQLTMKG